MSHSTVVAFEDFWKWVQGHPNCLISVGTPEVMLYDHDLYHWSFGTTEEGQPMLQAILGKTVAAELVFDPQAVTYVQAESRQEHFVFECIEESTEGVMAIYSFTLSHGYDPAEPGSKTGWVH